jgi:hypothetical protein
MRRFIIGPLVIALSLALISPAIAQDATPEPIELPAGNVTTSPVFWSPTTFWGGEVVPGGLSSLATFEEGAAMSLVTTGLEPGDTMTIWWIVFNNPEACAHGEGPAQCGEGDLLMMGGDEAVSGTVLYATGSVIGPSGEGHFSAYLATEDTTYVLGDGPGLTNPLGAEIHFVVRTHGPAVPGLVGEQVLTFGGGCNNAPEGTGAPGDFACTDLQFAMHMQ